MKIKFLIYRAFCYAFGQTLSRSKEVGNLLECVAVVTISQDVVSFEVLKFAINKTAIKSLVIKETT